MSEMFELGLLVLLASESVIFMMLGIIVLRRNIKNLANHFFASLFFIAAASTFINLLGKTFYQNEILIVFINIVGFLWLNSFIVITAGFIVINLGQKYFLEKRGRLWYFIIVLIFSVGMFIFQPGISYTNEYNGIYFIVSIPLGIYFLILITISTIFSGISILKTLQKASLKQKIIFFSFMVAIVFYWIAIFMTLLVDMRVVEYQLMDVTLIFYFIGLLLFFMSLMAPRKK